jgi:uncharacterized protein
MKPFFAAWSAHAALVAGCLAATLASAPANAAPHALRATATGIPLDARWKVTIYTLARRSFHHPAWGWQHSERNYDVALDLAKSEGLTVDRDVLFAACFLHDMSAFEQNVNPNVEHGDYAAIASAPILRKAGFPMAKYARVAAAERTHMFYRNPGTAPESIVLHDADGLDFLGDVGAARILSLTGERRSGFGASLKTLRSLLEQVPEKLITQTARRMGMDRARELGAFLDALSAETFGGRAD